MKKKILVSGLINLETNLKIRNFPVEYCPVLYPFNGIQSFVSGVGYNVAKALVKLGNEVNFCSIIGSDIIGSMVLSQFAKDGISDMYIDKLLDETPQSVILYDEKGKRQINVDLKKIQDTEYSENKFIGALDECHTAVLCNINFSRRYLKICKERGIVIATDVHTIDSVKDRYNADFMRYADILFFSNEQLKINPEEWVKSLADEYNFKIAVAGLGAEGALLFVRNDNFIGKFPAIAPKGIVNTIGAGDALFSAFVHFFTKTSDPYLSIKKAVYFAGCKISVSGASEGFISEEEVE